jgi:hypothetical protein
MLEDQVGGAFRPDPAASPFVLDEIPARDPDVLPAPDPAVADSARLRLAALGAPSAGQFAQDALTCPNDDFQAINSVISAANSGVARPADDLNVGAGLVVLYDLRFQLDRLEADLLDAAQQVGLTWDVIAAIIGIPAEQAQHRHHTLRTRQNPR